MLRHLTSNDSVILTPMLITWHSLRSADPAQRRVVWHPWKMTSLLLHHVFVLIRLVAQNGVVGGVAQLLEFEVLLLLYCFV